MAPIRETPHSSSPLASRCVHFLTRREQLGGCVLPQRVFVGMTLVCTSVKIDFRMKQGTSVAWSIERVYFYASRHAIRTRIV